MQTEVSKEKRYLQTQTLFDRHQQSRAAATVCIQTKFSKCNQYTKFNTE